MGINIKNEKKFRISYLIEVEKYPKKLLNFLKDNKISFKARKLYELKEEFYDPEEELPLIAIPNDLYIEILI